MNLQGLNLLQGFLRNQVTGIATLCTDGQGIYWVSNTSYDPCTGEKLPNINQLVPLDTIQAAQSAIATFMEILPNATIDVNPF